MSFSYNEYSKEVERALKSDNIDEKKLILKNTLFKAFQNGFIEAVKPKNKKSVSEDFYKKLFDNYITAAMPNIKEFIKTITNKYSSKFIVGFFDDFFHDIIPIIVSIYNSGFINGVDVAKDNNLFSFYVQHKEEILNLMINQSNPGDDIVSKD